MNKFLFYINEFLESLDIPKISDSSQDKYKRPTRNHSKSIRLKDE